MPCNVPVFDSLVLAATEDQASELSGIVDFDLHSFHSVTVSRKAQYILPGLCVPQTHLPIMRS